MPKDKLYHYLQLIRCFYLLEVLHVMGEHQIPQWHEVTVVLNMVCYATLSLNMNNIFATLEILKCTLIKKNSE